MNKIEEDIKILKDKEKALNEHIKNYEESNCTGSDVYRAIKREKEAIENILADRERLEKENEELKDIDFTTVYLSGYEDGKININKAIENARETIVKANKYDALVEKIKETDKDITKMKVEGDVFETAINFARKMLQELLEEEEV